MSVCNYSYGYPEEHQIGYLQIAETIKNRVNQNFNFEFWSIRGGGEGKLHQNKTQ